MCRLRNLDEMLWGGGGAEMGDTRSKETSEEPEMLGKKENKISALCGVMSSCEIVCAIHPI